jgi:hypothetical protein
MTQVESGSLGFILEISSPFSKQKFFMLQLTHREKKNIQDSLRVFDEFA